MSKRHWGPLVAIMVSAMAVSSLASAQDNEAVQARVKAGDLDLHSAQGRATLDSRLKGAARSACDDSGSAGVVSAQEDAGCRQQVMQQGNAQANAIVARQDAEAAARRRAAMRTHRAHHAKRHHAVRNGAHRHKHAAHKPTARNPAPKG